MTWDFKKKMEDMTDEEVAERIQKAMDFETPKIRLLPYKGLDNEMVIYESEELIARCPVTGYPDLYKIKIKFKPLTLIPELKSLKFYLMSYFDLPISHEHIVSKIYKEFKNQVQPYQLKIELDVAVRGGIGTKVVLGEINENTPCRELS